MSNVGRIVTLVVEIQTPEYPKWITDAHTKGGVNGVKVKVIAEGDLVAKLDKLSGAVYEEVYYDDLPKVADAMDDILG